MPSPTLAGYPWAVLSATMHASGPGACERAWAAIGALLRLRPRHFERYIQLVAASVGREVMQQVREQLPREDSETLSEYERRGGSFNLGLEEGRELGLASLRTALLGVLESRGLAVDDRARRRIAECSELDSLREWIIRAATVESVEALLQPE